MKRLPIFITVLGVLGALNSLLLLNTSISLSLPSFINEIIWPLLITIDVAIIAVSVVTQTQLIHSDKALYWILVIVFLNGLFSFVGWGLLTAKPDTNFYLFDATDGMLPYFDDAHAKLVDIATKDAIYKKGLGLRIYGGSVYDNGNGNNSQSCASNSIPIVEPSYYIDPRAAIDNYVDASHPGLDDIQIGAGGSLIVSIRRTLDGDIATYEKPVKLIIITSGTYSECGTPSDLSSPREYLPDTVKKFNDLNSNISLSMLIISIGPTTSQTAKLFSKYANAFNACYINIPSPSFLPDVVQASSNYCSNYLVGEPTPTVTR